MDVTDIKLEAEVNDGKVILTVGLIGEDGWELASDYVEIPAVDIGVAAGLIIRHPDPMPIVGRCIHLCCRSQKKRSKRDDGNKNNR